MPAWLRKQLEVGGKVTVYQWTRADGTQERVESIANETAGMVQLLAQLCEQDQSLEGAFLCHPGVNHVVKMWREGGFCGYRNIQMLISYIQAARSQGSEHFPGRLPNILRLQDLIEEAWDKGINSSGRIETGGIRGTRKYIGTPEVEAF
jgi:zinc finger-containing ubiquitin peptidase 1